MWGNSEVQMQVGKRLKRLQVMLMRKRTMRMMMMRRKMKTWQMRSQVQVCDCDAGKIGISVSLCMGPCMQ